MKTWLLTWTTYGTWLPGDDRGFVSRVPVGAKSWEIHNKPDTPYDHHVPALSEMAKKHMRGSPVRLNEEQATIVLEQLRKTAEYCKWSILAVAIMANHVHMVMQTPADVLPSRLLQVLKAYSSRALNERYGKPKSGTWWTVSASHRHLHDEASFYAAIAYVRQQEYPLAVFTELYRK